MIKKWKKHLKRRKKGSIMIEFIAVMPVIIVLIFILLESFIYAMVISDYKEAAEESARTVAMHLRGHSGPIAENQGDPPLPSGFSEHLEEQVRTRVDNVLKQNHFTSRFDALDPSKVTLITDENGGETACRQEMNNDSREQLICVYMVPLENNSGRDFEGVVVEIKGRHKPISNFWGLISDRHVMVSAISQKEMSKQFQYYYDDPHDPDLIEPIPEV